MSKVDYTQLTKLYYTIGEVAELFDVNSSLIRFWEKEFTSISPKKNKKGNRLFTPQDIEKINRIYSLVKVNGYTLDGAKKAIKKRASSIPIEGNGNHEVIKRLELIKSKLLQLKN